MSKRFVDYTPTELTRLSKKDFLDGIRAAEGRTVSAFVCPRAANYVEKVSNIELVASFGADLICIEGFDPHKLQMPGLPSKDKADDAPYKKDAQLEMGFGWSLQEMKKFVGRPMGIVLLVPDFEGQDYGPLYGESVYSPAMLRHLIDEGYDYVSLCAMNQEKLLNVVKEASQIGGDKIVISAGIPHGPGAIVDENFPPYNLRDLVTPEYLKELAAAGADIVGIPSVGVVPGFAIEHASQLADAIHSQKSLVDVSIAHSIEGTDEATLCRIAIDNRIAGADLFTLAAGGVFESVTLPEALLAFCIALKGKRHTYRRMCQSSFR
ncbi:hypothetical protein LJC60_03575 [Ruminococcaceae bacterium OttesenSCG-928-D13]|nr:hypothetical protein [Ruminococcaceae bacterium OttesenSCG-928-D13]